MFFVYSSSVFFGPVKSTPTTLKADASRTQSTGSSTDGVSICLESCRLRITQVDTIDFSFPIPLII